jgi:hypothetical protein
VLGGEKCSFEGLFLVSKRLELEYKCVEEIHEVHLG